MSAIPQKLKAAEAVAQGLSLAGPLPVARMKRLAAALAAPSGEIGVTLSFAPHPVALGKVSGTLKGELMLTCQRTLEPFAWTLDVPFAWLLARDEAEEERLLADADPVLLDAGQLMLADAIEDETLLALPLVPLSSAPAQVTTKKRGGKTKDPAMGDNPRLDDSRPNPFAALKGKLKG